MHAVPTGGLPPRFPVSAGVLDLSGEWRIRVSPSDGGPLDFVDPAFDDGGWEQRPVPSHFGTPAYTNVNYPFPVDPPFVPDENPTADYRCRFDAFEGFDSAVLRFEGVDSSARVWLNGTELGVTFGSRLPHEFAAGHLLRPTGNVLAVRVTQWSAGSYLEDQDMWWWPGIFREVTLIAQPLDVRVCAGYDHRTGLGTLQVHGATVVDGPDLSRPVRPWTAETPVLYDVTVESGGTRATLKVGFRTVTVDDGVLKVNGRRVLFRGVNRHEFDPDRGRVMSEEVMRADLELMKRHNVNAIRTSHYPPHPRLLELCDELGFWVIDECDFETHGFYFVGWKGNPTDDPAWRDALVDRVTRMVHRDHNRPSVIMWSLGNEAGVGANLEHMAAAIRAVDPSRPLHYEGDRSCEHTDVYSRMYAPVAEVEEIGRAAEGKPFILCEYAHAMGNGPGGLSEYQRLFETYERCQGGFVWEWIDHGLRTGDHFSYGGDFGEELHDGNFICDGLVFPDRSPSPGLLEFKKVVEPIRIAFGDGTFSVTNNYDFASLDGVTLRLRCETADGPVVEDSFPCPPLAPGESRDFALPEVSTSDDETWWTVSAWRDFEIAWEQHQVVPYRPLTGPDFDLSQLISLPRLDVWRAPVDNDTWGPGLAQRWRDLGLDRMRHRRVSPTRYRVAPAASDVALLADYEWTGSRLDFAVEPVGEWTLPLPRLGLSFEVPASWTEVEWYGRGPGESYPDSWRAGRIGRYRMSVADMQTPYVFPQENGGRMDVRWAILGGRLRLSGSEPFQLTVRPWSTAQLDAARHTSDLVPSPDRIWVHVDLAQHGLGSASCGPGVLPDYELWPRPARFTLYLQAPA